MKRSSSNLGSSLPSDLIWVQLNGTWCKTSAKAEHPPGCAGLALGWPDNRHAVSHAGSSAVSGGLPVGDPGHKHCSSLDRRWQTRWPLGWDWSLCFLTGGLSRRGVSGGTVWKLHHLWVESNLCICSSRLECQREFIKVVFFELNRDTVFALGFKSVRNEKGEKNLLLLYQLSSQP